MSSFFDEIAAKLATLSGVASPEVSRDELNEFNVRDIQAVRVSEGGGGGGTPSVKIVDWEFTQTNGDGTYTASFDLPADSLILAIGMQTTAEWQVDPDGAPLLIGDDDAADTYFTGSAGPLVGFFWTDFATTIAASDAWIFYENSTTITGSITTTGSVGTTGRTRVVILYASGVTVVDATKVDAP